MGSPRQISGPTMPTSRKKAMIAMPMAALRSDISTLNQLGTPRRGVRRTVSGAAGAGVPAPGPGASSSERPTVGPMISVSDSPILGLGVCTAMSLLYLRRLGVANARVKARVEQIDGQVRYQHAHHEDEQQGLD